MGARPYVVVLAVLVTTALSSSGWLPGDVPNPQRNARACHRTTKSSVCDVDGVLSKRERDQIEGVLNFIYEGTHGFKRTAPCQSGVVGYQVAVLLVRQMHRGYKPHDDDALRASSFARHVHDAWGVGDARCQNGVLLFVSLDDRQMYVSTGRGAELVLGEAQIQAVLNGMKLYMRQEIYGEGVLAGVTGIGKVLSGEQVVSDKESLLSVALNLVGAMLSLVFVSWGLMSSMSKRRKYKKCKAALRRIDDDTAAARGGDYTPASCPICLEELTAPPQREGENKREGDNERARENKRERKENKNPRVALPCGHQYHEKCIMDWVNSGNGRSSNRCPICRKRVDGKEDEPRPEPRDPRTCGFDEEAFEEERLFRIMRAHELYPDFVTLRMVRYFRSRRTTRLENFAEFVRLNPAVVEEARRSGMGGSSFEFSGGRSSGGGGSSW